MVDPKTVGEWLFDLKSATEFVKTTLGMLPKSPEKDVIESKIQAADEAMRRADVELAKDLGYRLCQCTFPPQVMLWKEGQQAHVCEKCGHKIERIKAARVRPLSWGRY